MWYNRVELQFQHDWRGTSLQNIYLLVCSGCLDTPQEQLRAITLPADPTPIFYPSVEDFVADSSDFRSLSAPLVTDPVTGIPIPSTALRVTEDGNNRTLLPFGLPENPAQGAVMPYDGAIQKAFSKPLALLSVTADGSCTIVVTCSAVHNLSTNDQVAVQGLVYGPACGFYSVTVVSATTFTYQTYAPNPAQPLLTPTSRIVTALVGLPRNYATIPKIYGPTPPTVTTGVAGGAFELETGLGAFLLEDGVTFFGLE